MSHSLDASRQSVSVSDSRENITVRQPRSSLLLEGVPFCDGIPPLFFVVADAFCEHLKSLDAAGEKVVLEQHHIYGLSLTAGINQRNTRALHEALNYILVTLGLEPDLWIEPEPIRWAKEASKSEPESPGYVYILSNPTLPGLVKIGYTRKSVAERVRHLSSSTSIPAPFKVVASFHTATPVAHEAEAHARLAPHRQPGREFFAVSEAQAIAACKSIIGEAA